MVLKCENFVLEFGNWLKEMATGIGKEFPLDDFNSLLAELKEGKTLVRLPLFSRKLRLLAEGIDDEQRTAPPETALLPSNCSVQNSFLIRWDAFIQDNIAKEKAAAKALAIAKSQTPNEDAGNDDAESDDEYVEQEGTHLLTHSLLFTHSLLCTHLLTRLLTYLLIKVVRMKPTSTTGRITAARAALTTTP